MALGFWLNKIPEKKKVTKVRQKKFFIALFLKCIVKKYLLIFTDLAFSFLSRVSKFKRIKRPTKFLIPDNNLENLGYRALEFQNIQSAWNLVYRYLLNSFIYGSCKNGYSTKIK